MSGRLTVARRLTSSSEAPREARPISWENSANFGSAKRGTWPSNSWQQSLKIRIEFLNQRTVSSLESVPGSLVWWNLRFGSVKWLWWMSNILCRVKYPKCKSSKEVTWWQETSNWSKSETGCFCQKVGNVLKLRDVVTWVTAVFFEKGKDVVEFATGTLFEQDSQFVVDFPPGGDLSWSVWHSRDSLMVSKKMMTHMTLMWPQVTKNDLGFEKLTDR